MGKVGVGAKVFRGERETGCNVSLDISVSNMYICIDIIYIWYTFLFMFYI